MTAVASPPSFQQINRPQWGANGSQGGLSSMNPDEVTRMFMPRKSAQRANSSSSLSSTSSGSSTSTTTITQTPTSSNGASMPVNGETGAWNTVAARKKPQRTGPWPVSKTETVSGVATTRPQSILATNGVSAASSMSSMPIASPIVPSQHNLQSSSQQQNGARQAMQTTNEGNPVLYLLSMNGTFDRKTISVPYYPDVLRIGRQTNAKTIPTSANGFFDSKVLSRQHAEIWADRVGKVWIRDVRSSNGTFVNGARLSPENRDSEPHELQSQDHLELGIDIVSEDQKTVVHHKVAAKVEHSGFLGSTTNILDMNFGDLDPANGSMMLPSQNGMQLRGRTSSQSSVASSVRMGPASSVATRNMGMGPQRPINFWLTPVTTEQIVKRLTHEMRNAKVQSNDLSRAESFFDQLLSKDEIKDAEKPEEGLKQVQVNGGSASFRSDSKPRFSDPPAPPPQQPLPDKPDGSGTKVLEFGSPSLKRTNTERPRSVPSVSPVRQEPTSQIITLVEALASQKKILDSQNGKIEELEGLLRMEREARETAEAHALRLEMETHGLMTNGVAIDETEGRIIEEAFEPPPEIFIPEAALNLSTSRADSAVAGVTEGLEATTDKLQEKLDMMMSDMREMKEQMESYRHRAEIAESERDTDRQTLAEMIEKIRAEEKSKREIPTGALRNIPTDTDSGLLLSSNGHSKSDVAPPESSTRNGKAVEPGIPKLFDSPLATILSRPQGSQDHLLYHSTPYASMLGVVLIGMGLMAYVNGWQKVET